MFHLKKGILNFLINIVVQQKLKDSQFLIFENKFYISEQNQKRKQNL